MQAKPVRQARNRSTHAARGRRAHRPEFLAQADVSVHPVWHGGIGGGGTWYWWTEKQKAEAVARLQKESQLAIPLGDFQGFEACLKKLG